MTSAPNIYIFKYSTDEKEFEKDDAIGQTQVQKDAKNTNAIIYEGSAEGNDIKPSNSETSNSKHQNFKTSNKSEFSNKQTENKRNGYDSSTSFNTPPPLTPPPLDAVKSSAIRNISSKFEPASLSNQMENINNAGDISKYINALMDEDNSRQSSLIQNKIKVFQSKIEKKGTNKDETVRKSNANLSLIKKDFGERREHKDLAIIKNTDVVLNKEESSIRKEDKISILNDKDTKWNRERDSVLHGNKHLELFNNRSGKQNNAVTPFKESKKIYTLTNMAEEPSDWIKKDGLQFVSVSEAKKVLLLSSIQTKSNGHEENIKRPSLPNNGDGNDGYEGSYNSGKSSSNSSQIKEIIDIQIIPRKGQPSLETKNDQPSLVSRNQPITKVNHTKIGNDISAELKESTTTSVKLLIEEYTGKKSQPTLKSSTWRGRPKSALISTSIMSFSEQQGSPANVKNNAAENNTFQIERKRRKSLNIDFETIPTTKVDNLDLTNQLHPKQRTLPLKKEVIKPQSLWNGYSERNQNIKNLNDKNSMFKNGLSTPNQMNSFIFQNGNFKNSVENNSFTKTQSMSLSNPIPPTPPSSPQNDPLSPSQFSLFSDNATTDAVPTYIPKKKSSSPSSAELKSTLKKELEKRFMKTKNDEIEVTEGMYANSLNDYSTTNHHNDSTTNAPIKPSSATPQNKSIRSSITSGREKYEISFEYKLKDYETKNKITKKWDKKEKSQNKDSQFAASMRKLQQDDALSQMVPRANGHPKGKKFVPRDDQTENGATSLSYAYHIGEKTKEEKEFEEGWVSVSDATEVSNRVADKKEEPPVDYDVSTEGNKRSSNVRNSQPPPPPPPPIMLSPSRSSSPLPPYIPPPTYHDVPPPPPPPPPPVALSSSISPSSPLPPYIPPPTYHDTPIPPPPPPLNNRSQRSTSSSGVDNRRKSEGFNLQPGMVNGGHKEDQIKMGEEEKKISKKDELLRKEPNPDYD